MPEVTSHSPGSFCWADLTSPDQPASKAFYSMLLGWKGEDNDMGDGVVYSPMTLRGKAVAGIVSNTSEQGVAPAQWGVYVSVASASDAAERARSLGSSVEGPIDVFDFGRMAFIIDPAGAGFRVWEPGVRIGAELLREQGSFAWFELSSADAPAAARFYSELFGWKVEGAPGMDEYLMATTASGEGTGAIQQSDGRMNGWLVYFWADEVDATFATATEHGAEAMVPPTDIPGGMGRFAILRDPQGAMFALFRA